MQRTRWIILGLCLLVHVAARTMQSAGDVRLQRDVRLMAVERLVEPTRVTLGDVAHGRPLLIVAWTTWCAYCRQELADGADLAAKLSALPEPCETVFVNVGEPRAVVASGRYAQEVASRIVLDPGADLARSFSVQAYPSYVLIDDQGAIIWSAVGLQKDLPGSVMSHLADLRGPK